MDVFNKLYTSVTSTVSQLSTVLPGNPLSREYEVTDFVTSAGHGSFWKIFNGYKKSTRQEVAIFVLEKKLIDKFSKEDREYILNILKSGIHQLTKIRHPNILPVQHPLEESRDCLAFATEPIFSSLSDSIKQNNSKLELCDVEVKHGLIQISEGLNFLHSDMKIIHRNLTPSNIIINKQGNWKIFGFDFCEIGNVDKDGNYTWKYQMYDSSKHMLLQPSLEYTAPEFVLNSTVVTESDLYAYGAIIYSIFTKGKVFQNFDGNIKTFQQFANNLNHGTYPSFTSIPLDLRDSLKGIIHPSPKYRLNLKDFNNIKFFNDVRVKTLIYLDSLYQWDNLQKSKFFKGLSNVIPSFSQRVNLLTITPSLVKEFLNHQMIPFVLPNVFLIAEKCNENEFQKHILPHLVPVFKLDEPIQIRFILIKNMNVIIKLTPTENIRTDVLPMIYRALEYNNTQMQEMCLEYIPKISSLIEFVTIKNSLLPKIEELCLKSQVVSVKVNCLMCIGRLLDNLDKWTVLDKVIPFLTKIENRDPATIMAIVGIIKIIISNSKLGITKHAMATKIIPFLMPLCIEEVLTVNQLNKIITLVKTMVNRVETEHRSTLEQIGNINNTESISNDSLRQEMLEMSNNNADFKDLSSASSESLPFTNIPMNQKTENISLNSLQQHSKISNVKLENNMNILIPNNISGLKNNTDIKSVPINNIFNNVISDRQISNNSNFINLQTNFLQPQNQTNHQTKVSNPTILTKEDIMEFLK